MTKDSYERKDLPREAGNAHAFFGAAVIVAVVAGFACAIWLLTVLRVTTQLS